MNLFLLQRHFLLFEEDLRTLVATIQVCATLIQLDLSRGLRRFVLGLFYGDAFTYLRQSYLVLNLTDADKLLLIWLVPNGLTRSDLDTIYHFGKRLLKMILV